MSKPPRFFITPDQVQGPRITVTGDDLRHIRTVLRKKTGDLLTLLDGAGAEYTVEIADMQRDAIVADVISQRRREVRGPRVILGQGLPKSDKMDWIVQKATELGVSSLVPLVTQRTVVKTKDAEKRIARWQKIAREAAMQSNRTDVPAVEGLRSLDAFLGAAAPATGTLLLLPWEEGTRPIKDALRSSPGAENIVVLIGPEGGFALSEAEAAREKGFHLVSLGPTVLRTETAAVAALSMISYEYLL